MVVAERIGTPDLFAEPPEAERAVRIILEDGEVTTRTIPFIPLEVLKFTRASVIISRYQKPYTPQSRLPQSIGLISVPKASDLDNRAAVIDKVNFALIKLDFLIAEHKHLLRDPESSVHINVLMDVRNELGYFRVTDKQTRRPTWEI